MRADENHLVDPDGVEIFYRRWLPDGEPRGIVLVLHGMSEHSGRYGRFAEALVDDGLAVYADDHRGFGRTAANSGVGVAGPNGFEGVLGSIRALHDRAIADLGELPVVVFGHSMGSMFAQAYVQRFTDLVGFVLSGTAGPAPELAEMAQGMQAMVDAGAGDEPIDALGSFNDPFQPARTDYDWLSRDAAEVDLYIADPMCGSDSPVTAGFLAGLLSLLHDATQAEAIGRIPAGTPVLLVTGEADPVSNGGESARILEAMYRDAGLDVTSHYYPDTRHEVLNETNRDEVTADIRRWLGGVIG